MYKNKSILAIIPARKNSKRIKNKNLLVLNKKSLVEIAILESLKSKHIDKLIVCSDSYKINKIASKFHCIPSIKRPNHLSNDNSKSIDLVKYYSKQYSNYDFILLLQPTSPFRKFSQIDEAIKIIINKKLQSLVSIGKINFPKSWINKKKEFHKFVNLNNFKDKNQYYKPNGAIYILENTLIKNKNTKGFYFNHTFFYEMDKISSIDIDENTDYLLSKQLENKIIL